MEEFPQSRPLWEVHVIKYPAGNGAGSLVFKLHHSLGDGYSLMGALLSCLRRADNPSLPLTFPSTTRKDSKWGNNWSSIWRRNVLRGAIKTTLDFGWSLLSSSTLKDDRTPVRSGEDGVEYRPVTVTTMTFSLDHIKQIKDILKVTVNDVVTGIIFLGTRLYVKKMSYRSSNARCTGLVLLNTRVNIGGYKLVSEMVKPNAEAPRGNHLSYLHISVPKLRALGTSNPLDFIFSSHQAIKRKRNSSVVYLTGKLLDLMRKLRGPEATAGYIHNTLKRSSMTLYNTIGPIEQMALANHPVTGLFFMSLGLPESLTITIVSYMGKLRIAAGTENGFVDPHIFKLCIENAFDMVLQSIVIPAPYT